MAERLIAAAVLGLVVTVAVFEQASVAT